MSQRIELWQLNHDDQDMLWINNQCPKCGSRIIERASTENYITWFCKFCDVAYWIE